MEDWKTFFLILFLKRWICFSRISYLNFLPVYQIGPNILNIIFKKYSIPISFILPLIILRTYCTKGLARTNTLSQIHPINHQQCLGTRKPMIFLHLHLKVLQLLIKFEKECQQLDSTLSTQSFYVKYSLLSNKKQGNWNWEVFLPRFWRWTHVFIGKCENTHRVEKSSNKFINAEVNNLTCFINSSFLLYSWNESFARASIKK